MCDTLHTSPWVFNFGRFAPDCTGLPQQIWKRQNCNQVIKPGPGRPAGIVENCTVYDGLEIIDSEFYPRNISVPDTENGETETTSKLIETNKTIPAGLPGPGFITWLQFCLFHICWGSPVQWGLCEYVIVHTILGGSPVILWISLGGKPKWLPLKFGYYNAHKPHLARNVRN